jgi:peptidoglycan/LPS O-acetylase OafA/YrhL
MVSLSSQIAGRKCNNINIIRLLLALMVIFSHSFPVALGPGGDSRYEPLNIWTCRQASSGSLAVFAFFFISGFLITASWLRSKSIPDYFMKRVLRIYPGFIVAIGFTAALIWAFCPQFRAVVLQSSPMHWLWLLLHDWLLLTSSSISQPGVFAGNPFPILGNASLWTISVEFLCYLSVLVIGLFGLFKQRLLILGIALLSYETFVLSTWQAGSEYDECLICFVAGATAWICQDKIPFSKWLAAGCLAVLLGASQFTPWFLLVFPILGGYCLLWLAYEPTLAFSGWADTTDLSYGTYLYAFPIQQMLAMCAALRHPWAIFILATPLTLLAAWLSWSLVEKRFIAMKSSARKAT